MLPVKLHKNKIYPAEKKPRMCFSTYRSEEETSSSAMLLITYRWLFHFTAHLFYKWLFKAGVPIYRIPAWEFFTFSLTISIASIVLLGSFILIFFWSLYYIVRFFLSSESQSFSPFHPGLRTSLWLFANPVLVFFFHLICVLLGVSCSKRNLILPTFYTNVLLIPFFFFQFSF